MASCLLSYAEGIFWNGVYVKLKELPHPHHTPTPTPTPPHPTPLGTNVFLLEYTHLLKGDKKHFDRFASPESVSIPLNIYFLSFNRQLY